MCLSAFYGFVCPAKNYTGKHLCIKKKIWNHLFDKTGENKTHIADKELKCLVKFCLLLFSKQNKFLSFLMDGMSEEGCRMD